MLCTSCGADAGDISSYCPSCGAAFGRPPGDEYVGRTLARKYQVEALIGEGGMGKVYRARQVALDKLVVLKVLRHSLLSDERTVARFKREAKAASRLNHPNSISILDFGQAEDEALFIAMEFVPGQDLHTVLSKEGPLPEPRIVRIVSQVLSALSDAHGAGVIHRDLKPENIMVEQRRNEPDFVKVLDFGIAKIQDGGDDGPALTRTGFVCGTPEYMSPEQARGAVLDHRSDLYAVGVLLYQLVTGRLPFESDSAVGYATKHLTEEPLPPSRRRPDLRISPAMERLIMRTLSKDPNDRPADAEAFKLELLAVEKEREPRERRPGGASRRPGVLSSMPRRPTPGASTTLELRTEPGWRGDPESTVRALPEQLHGGATSRAAQERTQIAPPPSRPERERERGGPISQARPERAAPPTVQLDNSLGKTEATVLTVPEAEGGFGFFKALTLTLVVVSLGLGGSWLFSSWRGQAADTFVPPPNAPVPGQASGSMPSSGANPPLYEQEVPPERRDTEQAERLKRSGLMAYKRGDLDLAATEFKKAFLFNPTPELSLKLGETYWHRGYKEEARGWWRRHLRDQADSKARDLIQERLQEMAGTGSP